MKTISSQIIVGMSLTASVMAAPAPLPPPPMGAPLPPPSLLNVSAPLPPPPGAPNPGTPPPRRPSVPLAGISAAQLAEFQDGRAEFIKEEGPEGGLGPIFNDVSCVACHDAGGVGGAGRKSVVRFGRVTNGVFDPLVHLGGSLLQKRSISRESLETIPREANVFATRITTPLFGAGLIEAIPDSTILEYAALPKPDGIKGRAAMVTDPVSGEIRVGRFGWKAQHASLLGFSGDAYLNEMGITSRLFPTENAPNGKLAVLARADKYADPEDVVDPGTQRGDIDSAASFMRLLAPLPRGPVTAQVTAGSLVFHQVGCAQCHKAEMVTGTAGPEGTRAQVVALYSDLLLHDMGALGDGIAQPPATMKEMRTAPLWGLRVRERYLHDGRATTVDLAIRAHDGEAKVVRDRYRTLSTAQRFALLEFLKSI